MGVDNHPAASASGPHVGVAHRDVGNSVSIPGDAAKKHDLAEWVNIDFLERGVIGALRFRCESDVTGFVDSASVREGRNEVLCEMCRKPSDIAFRPSENALGVEAVQRRDRLGGGDSSACDPSLQGLA